MSLQICCTAAATASFYIVQLQRPSFVTHPVRLIVCIMCNDAASAGALCHLWSGYVHIDAASMNVCLYVALHSCTYQQHT